MRFVEEGGLDDPLICDIYFSLSYWGGDGIYEMGHTHAHESYLSLPLKPHDLKREGNVSQENANVVHLVHINSVHEYDTYFIAGKIKMEL